MGHHIREYENVKIPSAMDDQARRAACFVCESFKFCQSFWTWTPPPCFFSPAFSFSLLQWAADFVHLFNVRSHIHNILLAWRNTIMKQFFMLWADNSNTLADVWRSPSLKEQMLISGESSLQVVSSQPMVKSKAFHTQQSSPDKHTLERATTE